jgi:D-3-phosphoglycerate dehydrogenase / 2-oxoglutarate reductase
MGAEIVDDSSLTALRHCHGPFQRALVLENPDPSLDGYLESMGIEVERIDDAPGEAQLAELLSRGKHDLIYKRSKVEITERVLAASDRLAAVMLCCIGDDSVDKQAAADRGVIVTNDPVSNGRSVAELAIGSLVGLSRRLFDSVGEMEQSIWKKNNIDRFELKGKRLGILGLGAIGRQVGQLGQAMGMEIIFYDSGIVSYEVGIAMGWTSAKSLDELFQASDFVSCHVSATDVDGHPNHGLVTYEHLKMLGDKPGESPRVFLNLARGFLVEPSELLRAVQDGHVGYAMTDVFPQEPGRSGASQWKNPFEGEPRILATPHIGAATREAQPRIAKYVARTTELLSRYGMIRNCVFRPRSSIQFEVPKEGCLVSVVHADKRGTKKAVDDAIYEAGANNLRSAHIDFPEYGVAYELSALDRALSSDDVAMIAARAASITGDSRAIRLVRTMPIC